MIRVVIRVAIENIDDDDAIAVKKQIEYAVAEFPEARIDFSITTLPDRPT